VHENPISMEQLELHPSPSLKFPSSHGSLPMCLPSPQISKH
jgi:hypothetical protein